MHVIAMALSALLVGTLSACMGDPNVDEGDAQVRVTAAYEAPPAWMNTPISIGGYAFFVEITGPRNVSAEITASGFIESLPPGHYKIEVVSRPQSDAMVVDAVTGDVQRELGPITARCSTEVDLHSSGRAVVDYTAIGGDACRLVAQS